MTSERTEPNVTHECGATSSECPDFAQIPLVSLISLARRFMLGAKKHGRDNYRKGLTDKAYVIARINHVIYHCLKLVAKLEGRMADNGDDDAGAIIWGGAFACEAMEAMRVEREAAAVVGWDLAEPGGDKTVETIIVRMPEWENGQALERIVDGTPVRLTNITNGVGRFVDLLDHHAFHCPMNKAVLDYRPIFEVLTNGGPEVA